MISRIGFAAALIGAAFASPLAAQDKLASEEAEAIRLALERGQALRAHDQAAWHTTDAMLEDIKNPAQSGIRGWVINNTADGLEAVFYRPTDTGFEAVWSGVHVGKSVLARTTYEAGERSLTPMEVAKAKAKSLPGREKMQRCSSKPFNSVVLPTGKDDGSLFVYYLVPQERMDEVPLGGHYRYEVRDGKIVDSRKFTNSCISLPLKQGKDGQRPVMLMISHLLDDIPTEIHVFSMFAAGIPIAVSTVQNEKLWAVESTNGQARVRVMQR